MFIDKPLHNTLMVAIYITVLVAHIIVVFYITQYKKREQLYLQYF